MKTHFIFSIFIFLVFACGGTKNVMDNSPETLALGKQKYRIYCAACHGQDGKLNINGAKDLSKYRGSKKRKIRIITNGKGLMMPFRDILTAEEIEAIASYISQLRKK